MVSRSQNGYKVRVLEAPTGSKTVAGFYASDYRLEHNRWIAEMILLKRRKVIFYVRQEVNWMGHRTLPVDTLLEASQIPSAPLGPPPALILRMMYFKRANTHCKAKLDLPPQVFEGYGSTETLGSLSSANASDREGGHVGAPAPGLKVILADIPSMGIVAERDNKGEICVKGPSCTSGYFKDPDNTAKLFDSEGWMHTGDVGIWTEKNSLRIVDRCKHIFKLSQGEYVAPEKIEWVYLESRFVSQVFVDGDTEQAYPVAIVVPEVETLVQHINSKAGSEIANGDSSKAKLLNGYARPQNGGDVNASGEQAPPSVTAATVDNTTFVVHGTRMTIEELCDYEPAIKAVLDDLSALGKARGLKGFEQVKAIQLSPAPFTIENGMLTPTLKAAREIIRRQFRSAIKALYQPYTKISVPPHLACFSGFEPLVNRSTT
ncbi:Long-chain-fatty-acid--CoA ligase [Echinococcus granulosus]|uniref:long-chain-fatty-acid--CoA ligase n=1 Tax=Echinococcus granulosus TaxID=6210 RepID=W6VBG6_ECHGR|nr:Long-chain-fatty-acid--CoA ligase [Echinococcus granulosus]EUB64164.1 Long-chain-fatty-acid--CoA ligase [Echinococcus granulosus]